MPLPGPAGAAVICWGRLRAGWRICAFRQQGLTVTAFDASRAQAAAAASRLCGQPVRVCRFEQMQSVVPYDGIWASGSPALSAREHEIARRSRSSGHPAQGRGPSTPLPHADGRTAATVGEYPLQTRFRRGGAASPDRPLPLTLHHHWVQGR